MHKTRTYFLILLLKRHVHLPNRKTKVFIMNLTLILRLMAIFKFITQERENKNLIPNSID